MCPTSKAMKTYEINEVVIKATISFLFGTQDLPEHFVEYFSQFLKLEMEENFNVFFILSKLNRNFQFFMSKYPSLCWENKGVTFFRGILSCYSDYRSF